MKMSERPTMLVVDDVEINRTKLKELFYDKYHVLEAEDGQEALHILRENHIYLSIVLLDIEMPILDGFKVLEMIQEDEMLKKIPVIAVTELNEEHGIKALKLGAIDFIGKPFNSEIVKHRITNVVSKMQLEKEHVIETMDQKRMSELRFQAERDALTGIYNRTTFGKYTEQMIRANLEEQYVIICWDIARFKVINELFGSITGDRILKAIANEFIHTLTGVGTYGRLESDHFVICGPEDILVPETIQNMMEKCLSKIPINYNVIMYFGIYRIEDLNIPIDQMCDRAKLALNTVKGNYLKRYAYYDDVLRDALLEEQEIIGEMKRAMEEGQFSVYLQPIYSVTTEQPISAEALVRWNHPVKGQIAPTFFIPIFEKNGFITKLDIFVWEEVCKYLQYRKECGKKMIPISVNVSRINLYNPSLCEEIATLIRRYDLDPSMLRLEITESAYTDNPYQLIEAIKTLRAHEFTIAMDDFGSGYSSLNMLKDIAIDILKIDMNFIDDLQNSARAANVMTSIVRMAKWLNIPVVAEGVETKEQLDFLRGIGCDRIQGFYFAKPMPLEAFDHLLDQVEEEAITEENILDQYDFDTIWDSNKEVNLLFNGMIGGMGVYELYEDKMIVVRVNRAYYELLGGTPQTLFQDTKDSFEKIVDIDRPSVLENCRKAMSSKEVEQVQVRRFHENGKMLWLDIKMRYLGKAGNRPLFYFALNDITQQKQAELRIEERGKQYYQQGEMYRMLMEESQMIMFDYDILTKNMHYSMPIQGKGREEFSIYNYPEFLGNGSAICKEDSERIKKIMGKLEETICSGELEFQADFYGNGLRWYRAYLKSITDENDIIYRVIGRAADIQKEKIAEVDTITKLFNRQTTEQHINDILLASEDGEIHTFLAIDVDNFKKVNDTYGHLCGDILLKGIGEIFQKIFRKTDVLGRIGGDEFVVFMNGVGSPSLVKDKAMMIQEELERFKDEKQWDVKVAISIGVSVAPRNGTTFRELYKNADKALYVAKEQGKNRLVIHTI